MVERSYTISELAKEFGDVPDEGAAVGGSQRGDAIAALVSLGYKQNDASNVVGQLAAELSSEELIREALKTLSGRVL